MKFYPYYKSGWGAKGKGHAEGGNGGGGGGEFLR